MLIHGDRLLIVDSPAVSLKSAIQSLAKAGNSPHNRWELFCIFQDPWVCGLEAASECNRDQEQNTEHFKTPRDNRFQTDRQTQAVKTKELLESSLRHVVPFYRADPPACCLLKDTQFTSLSTFQTPNCSQHQTVETGPSDAVELHPPVQEERDTCAMRSVTASDPQTDTSVPAQKKGWMEKCSEDPAQQITSITFSSRKRLRSPLSSLAHSSGLSRDGLDGMMPLEVDSTSSEEQSHGNHLWERSRTRPPSSPVLAGLVSDEIAFTAEKDRFHRLSTDKNRVGAYRETDCLSEQDSGSISAAKRQTLSAKNSDVPPQDVTAFGRHSARLGGLDCDIRFSQETNRFNEPHSRSSYQQDESSSPGHSQVYESLEGSGPAVQTDLLKDQSKLLEEEEKSPCDEVALIQKEVAMEQIGTSHRSPVDEILSTTAVSPSSPTKKVLSCVHITLSPKCNNSELCSGLNTENETRSWDKPVANTQPVPLKTPEAVSKLSAADFIPEDQRCSAFPMPGSPGDPWLALPSVTSSELPPRSSERPRLLGSGGRDVKNVFDSAVPARTGKSTSDAATQITTESPEKTTFSAEIYVNSQDSENAACQSSVQKARELPTNAASSLNKVSSFPRQGGEQISVLFVYRDFI